MTREEAIQYAEKKIDSASYRLEMGYLNNGLRQIVSNEYEFFMQALSALRQQELFCEVTKKVDPLTLDELREMDGEPVWVQSPGVPEYGRWAIVEGVGENCLFLHDDFTCHDYGKTWLAYRQKPEEGTV